PLGTLLAAAAGHDACTTAQALQHATAPGQTDPARPSGRGAARVGCGCAAPAEVDGQPITAAHLRALLEQLDALCPGGLQAPAGGTLDIALTDPISGALRATVTRTELERLVRRGCADHPGGRCACPVLDRPPPVDRYAPTPAHRRFTSTRDRTCRHPGCHHDAAWADLDHVLPHNQGGATACENLCCLCRRHHRLKTHARGWSFSMAPDGTLTVTTPSGVTRTTHPPGLREPDRPRPSPDDDDPPPF
ncbi:MAG TPA: HNH endonuclease signature motif containing protein, partial [Blastococcus sp.]